MALLAVAAERGGDKMTEERRGERERREKEEVGRMDGKINSCSPDHSLYVVVLARNTVIYKKTKQDKMR